jgi:predicted RNase H-like nuclease (RuvC/YqgF family)
MNADEINKISEECEKIATNSIAAYWEYIQPYINKIEKLNINIKGLEGELSRWLAPHDDSDLQEMKEQSDQPSLAAKQAYINALEWRVKHLEAELENKIKSKGGDI